MARKPLNQQRAEKLAQLDALKKDLAMLEAKAAERIGRLAVRAGLADLALDDELLLKEFHAIAARFREGAKGEARPAPASAD